jgi:pilus assembly protein Flp/PilA
MLSNFSAALQRFFVRIANEEGQALAEYGLIIALVAIFLIGALGVLAVGIEDTFNEIVGSMPGGS